ncbi:mitochondrial import inner membrane translocase subunit Tim23B isoform X3 [Nycticebus coucang]|uniref:mitochondrial import inner membrane translocase subunit Tim23B isoform X3 n=1 Tax=Nycticebus coucang TaxID=9470 RepID=UPI00234D2573|nr:mitochondrial import inner membrane translocase subunit Tim23B isoform X3 [Nycticebus coucang]
MEGGGGSGNKTTGGLAGFFGAGGAGYSHADLAGVPLTGMNPLSPYLNVDPRYLVQDTDEFILPTGANKTRGRFELAFFTIGGCCMTGAAFGAVNGLRLGLKETQNMAWSKPRNVQILNMVTRQGALWANTLGSLALLYSAFGVIIEKTRGAEDDLNTVAAGTMTGMLYKCTEPQAVVLGRVLWHHSSQQPPTPGLKRFSCLSLPSSWIYRHPPQCLAFFGCSCHCCLAGPGLDSNPPAPVYVAGTLAT